MALLSPLSERDLVNVVHRCRYVPVSVDERSDASGLSAFQLRQGIQRRIGITIVHENGPELIWRDVSELVVGRIRKTVEWNEPDGEDTVIALNILPAHYMKHSNDDRCVVTSSQ